MNANQRFLVAWAVTTLVLSGLIAVFWMWPKVVLGTVALAAVVAVSAQIAAEVTKP